MVGDPVPHLEREVEILQDFNDPQRLQVVAEARMEPRYDLLSQVTEGGMAEVVTEADRFDEVFVQRQCPRDGAGDLRHLERMSEPNTIVIALGRQEDLGLVSEAAKGLAMHDPVTIHLETRPDLILCFGPVAPPGIDGTLCSGSEGRFLQPFPLPAKRVAHARTLAPGDDVSWVQAR